MVPVQQMTVPAQQILMPVQPEIVHVQQNIMPSQQIIMLVQQIDRILVPVHVQHQQNLISHPQDFGPDSRFWNSSAQKHACGIGMEANVF